MTSATFSDVRKNFKSYLDQVNDNHDEVYIIRQRGDNAVLVSEEERANIQENLHIYKNKDLVERIRLSKEQLQREDAPAFDSLADFKASLS